MRPALQLLFAGYGGGDPGEFFVVNELVDFVTGGEGVGVFGFFVLGYALFYVGGDADVQYLEGACHDVDVGDFGHAGDCGISFGG